jgi:hypothetical protein
MCVLQLVHRLFGAWDWKGRAAAWAAVLTLCAGHALWPYDAHITAVALQLWPYNGPHTFETPILCHCLV